MNPIEVMAHQVWADNDPRSAGRTLRVDEVRYSSRIGGMVAACTILTNADETQETLDKRVTDPTYHSWSRTSDRRGTQTVISVKRFKPNSTGYRLVADVADGPAVARALGAEV